jgi:hypothetical protein
MVYKGVELYIEESKRNGVFEIIRDLINYEVQGEDNICSELIKYRDTALW